MKQLSELSVSELKALGYDLFCEGNALEQRQGEITRSLRAIDAAIAVKLTEAPPAPSNQD